MVVISLTVGGFSAIPFARQKFDRYFRTSCGLADKVGIWVVRVMRVFMCVKKFFVHLVPFVCELFIGKQPCRMENRQVTMFESNYKTLLCRLAFVSDFYFAKISRK